jgi:hypothetical protein
MNNTHETLSPKYSKIIDRVHWILINGEGSEDFYEKLKLLVYPDSKVSSSSETKKNE